MKHRMDVRLHLWSSCSDYQVCKEYITKFKNGQYSYCFGAVWLGSLGADLTILFTLTSAYSYPATSMCSAWSGTLMQSLDIGFQATSTRLINGFEKKKNIIKLNHYFVLQSPGSVVKFYLVLDWGSSLFGSMGLNPPAFTHLPNDMTLHLASLSTMMQCECQASKIIYKVDQIFKETVTKCKNHHYDAGMCILVAMWSRGLDLGFSLLGEVGSNPIAVRSPDHWPEFTGLISQFSRETWASSWTASRFWTAAQSRYYAGLRLQPLSELRFNSYHCQKSCFHACFPWYQYVLRPGQLQ